MVLDLKKYNKILHYLNTKYYIIAQIEIVILVDLRINVKITTYIYKLLVLPL